MKIETFDNNFFIFMNSSYVKINFTNEEIINLVKDKIVGLKRKLNIRGFYKVVVFFDERVGIFIEGKKLDDIEYSNVLDLRVIVSSGDIYFETDDYFVIKDVKSVMYFGGKYLCSVRDISNINSVLEYGKFIYGDEALKKIDKAILIN